MVEGKLLNRAPGVVPGALLRALPRRWKGQGEAVGASVPRKSAVLTFCLAETNCDSLHDLGGVARGQGGTLCETVNRSSKR